MKQVVCAWEIYPGYIQYYFVCWFKLLDAIVKRVRSNKHKKYARGFLRSTRILAKSLTEIGIFVKIKKPVIRFLQANKFEHIKIHTQWQEMYCEDCISVQHVHKWCRELSEGRRRGRLTKGVDCTTITRTCIPSDHRFYHEIRLEWDSKCPSKDLILSSVWTKLQHGENRRRWYSQLDNSSRKCKSLATIQKMFLK